LLKQFVYPGSTKEAYEYTGEGNLSKVTNTKSSGAQISQYTYTYDASGNQDSKAEGGVTTTYLYDNLNRVESIKEGGTAVVAYTYDKSGNILSVTNNYTKDANLAENFKYDELNRLIEYTDGAGVKTTYTYYPNGLRATKTTGGHTTKYYYDGSNVIIETVDGVLSARNLRGLNYIGRQDAAGNTNYFLYNGHGDVTSTVDSTGTVKNQYTYDIYGYIKAVNETGISNPIRYAGQYYDSESGLYYLRARYYDSRIGRFINEDTNKGDINNPSSLNLYTYCWGNPIRLYDPSGNIPDDVYYSYYYKYKQGTVNPEPGMQNLIDQYNTLTDATMLVPVMALGIAGGGGDAKNTTATLTVAASAAAKIGAAKEAVVEKATSLIKDVPSLVKEAGKMGNNEAVQKEANNLIKEFLKGNTNPGIGSKNLIEDINYLRGRNGARVFYRIVEDTMEILGKSSKANEQKVIDIILDIYKKR
jgi:RHS repeat-associated protein